MLPQLTQLTNSPDFIDRGDLRVVEVHSRPGESADVWLTLEVHTEEAHTYQEHVQVWRVHCLETPYSFGNGLRDYKRPYNQLRVYADHPVLFNYQAGTEFDVRGQCTDVPALLGSLYEAHGEACGQWIDFSWQFSHLAWQLRTQQHSFLRVPTRLLPVYLPIFQQYGLTHTAEVNEPATGRTPPLQVLLFSNPAVCPDTFNLQQPYQVAQAFAEQRLA